MRVKLLVNDNVIYDGTFVRNAQLKLDDGVVVYKYPSPVSAAVSAPISSLSAAVSDPTNDELISRLGKPAGNKIINHKYYFILYYTKKIVLRGTLKNIVEGNYMQDKSDSYDSQDKCRFETTDGTQYQVLGNNVYYLLPDDPEFKGRGGSTYYSDKEYGFLNGGKKHRKSRRKSRRR
jgi:hypothetical protein